MLIIGQFSKVLIGIDNAHSTIEGLDCGPGLGGLNQAYDVHYVISLCIPHGHMTMPNDHMVYLLTMYVCLKKKHTTW